MTDPDTEDAAFLAAWAEDDEPEDEDEEDDDGFDDDE